MSTAITSSAPIWRANCTGTGAASPPSTYSCVPICTGWNTAGTALEARTATPGVAAPEQDRLAAVEVGGDDAERRGISSSRLAAGLLTHEAGERLAADQAAAGIQPVGEASTRPCLGERRRARARSCPRRTSPRRGCRRRCRPRGRAGCPFSSSTWITPMWAKPRAAPPPSARPMRGRRGRGGEGARRWCGRVGATGDGPAATGVLAQPTRPSRAPVPAARPRAARAEGDAAADSASGAAPRRFPYATRHIASDKTVVRICTCDF